MFVHYDISRTLTIITAYLPAETVCAFSDGSSSGPGQLAWGYMAYQGDKLCGNGSGPLPGVEVFDAEVVGTMRALETVVAVGKALLIRTLLDNQAAALELDRGRSNSSLTVVGNFSLLRHDERVEMRWIPGHMGIQGNEEADMRCKRLRNWLYQDGRTIVLLQLEQAMGTTPTTIGTSTPNTKISSAFMAESRGPVYFQNAD